MELSSQLCRVQEAYHRDLAASASLSNVRMTAENAAIAWGKQAVIAELAESRRRTGRSLLKPRLESGRVERIEQLTDDDVMGWIDSSSRSLR